MKIAIISDSHDNLVNLEKFLDWIKKEDISLIIHCGDLCAPSVLKILAENFSGQIHLIYGNVSDRELLEEISKEYKNVKLHGDFGEIKINNKKIAFLHKPAEGRELAQTGNYDLVFYGHNHKPWEEKINNCRLLNPGTLGGMFYKATFAIYDLEKDKLELKILELL